MKHIRYLKLAREISTWSKDPSSKIGAVYIGSKGQVLSQGFNGFPRGIEDTSARWGDRETKYKHVVHAEMNGIYNATYNGTSLENSTLYLYGLPMCTECAKGIIQVGVQSVHLVNLNTRPVWNEVWKETIRLLDECEITHHVHSPSELD